MKTSVAALLIGILVSVIFAAGCAGNEEATEQDTQQTGKETTAERTKARAKDTKSKAREATLEMEGDQGTEFSGTCTVGGEETEISGQVPDSFSYELDGDRLECAIGANGNLRIVFTAGQNTRSVQQVNGGTINLTYDNGQVSFSSSSGSGGQASQSASAVSSSSQSSSSSVNISP